MDFSITGVMATMAGPNFDIVYLGCNIQRWHLQLRLPLRFSHSIGKKLIVKPRAYQLLLPATYLLLTALTLNLQ